MKLSSDAEKLGTHYNTAYRLFQRGQIPGYQLPTGTVIIEEPVDQTANLATFPQLVAAYARVSSTEHTKHLDTQAERLITLGHAQGWSVGNVLKACDSGITYQRPTLLALLANRDMHWIVGEHKDRASRFGIASMQTLLAMQDRELVIVTPVDTAQDDVMGDFEAIIPSCAARPYGRRRANRKTEQVLAVLQQDGSARENDSGKSH